MIDKNIATTASNVIYSAFLAVICSNFYVVSQGETFGFYNPALELPFLNKVFLICVILYLVMNWLTDTLYHASPGMISDLYLVGSLSRIILFGFCFYESFNADGFKFYLFFCAGLIEIVVEYFAYRVCILPVIKHAEKAATLESGSSSAKPFIEFGFAAVKVVPSFIFFFRILALVGILIFSIGLPDRIDNSNQKGQVIAVVVLVVIFTLVKLITWLIIRQKDLVSIFEPEEVTT